MTTQEIRRAYLDFFADRGHTVIPRSNIVPQQDATTLFTGSGMQPMIPYLLGEKHPAGVRLVNSQVCLRAEDIDEIGDNRHTTYFEMLGNWSLGDYFKTEQIAWIFEFLTQVVKIDPTKLYITCFIGAPEYNIPKDTVSAALWKEQFSAIGIEASEVEIGSEADGYTRGMGDGRIFYYDGSKNWWSRNGGPQTTPAGDPCGPDSEMFYDFGTDHDPSYGTHCHPNCDCGRFMEIGNNVFMSYLKEAEGVFVPLKANNIDHGSGLERIAAASLNDPDVYKISLMWPVVLCIEKLSKTTYAEGTTAMRIIVDHLRAATWMAVDGVVPSNTAQGYVMRRLVRRAIRQAHALGLKDNFFDQVIPVITELYRDDFPEVQAAESHILEVMMAEEIKFRRTLERGLKEFNKIARTSNLTLTGANVFMLSDTYGFPAELSVEVASEQGIPADPSWRKEFDELMQEQKERSRTATKGQFKGGLQDQSDISTKYHTATHLMYQALREVLGDHVVQRGSNITHERLRFDFSHGEKVTAEQIAAVEHIVNTQIAADLIVTWEEHPTRVAIDELHALGQFGDRYGETVKVYRMQKPGSAKPFSFEICGGPHVDHTARLAEDNKVFKIKKEESSSSGVRRIKAVLV